GSSPPRIASSVWHGTEGRSSPGRRAASACGTSVVTRGLGRAADHERRAVDTRRREQEATARSRAATGRRAALARDAPDARGRADAASGQAHPDSGSPSPVLYGELQFPHRAPPRLAQGREATVARILQGSQPEPSDGEGAGRACLRPRAGSAG